MIKSKNTDKVRTTTWINGKMYKKLRIKLLREDRSFSSWVQEKIENEVA